MLRYPKCDRHGRDRTPWAVHCFGDDGPGHGLVYLTTNEYDNQMIRVNSLWKCPLCGIRAEWDDDNYEEWYSQFEDTDEV